MTTTKPTGITHASTKALLSIDRARALLDRCRTVSECMRIKAIAQAVASMKAGEAAGIEAAQVVLLAKARVGVLTAALHKAKPGRGGKGKKSLVTAGNKSSRLAAEGISRKAAAENEKIAALQESGELDRFYEASKAAWRQPTTTGAVSLARLDARARKSVLSQITSGVDIRRAISDAGRAVRVKKLATIAAGEMPLTGKLGRFPVVYADPPWRYEHVKTESRAVENQYPTMEFAAICAMPIADITTSDAILFLWATSPKLAEAMHVVESWGFTYRTCAVWTKDKIGMGYYFRQQHELLLVATKGSIPVPAPADRPSSIIASARGMHSAKPVEAIEAIERMYLKLPKLELFCRKPRAGWSVWGNESEAAAE